MAEGIRSIVRERAGLRLAGVLSVLLAGGCALLPPSLRHKEAPAETVVVAPGESAAAKTAKTDASDATRTEIKTYPGTGNFVNLRPLPPQGQQQPVQTAVPMSPEELLARRRARRTPQTQ